MTKHKLSVDYSDVDERVMANARIFGEVQHKWLERYFKGLARKDELQPIGLAGVEMIENNGFVAMGTEERVHNNLVAGTIDLIAFKGVEEHLLDFKFTYNYNAYSIMWQLNIYRVLIKHTYGTDIKGLHCLWYNKPKEEYELREVPMLDDKIIRLIQSRDRRSYLSRYTK